MVRQPDSSRTWFIDRFQVDPHREKIAEELAKQIVDPILQSRGIINFKSTALTGLEAQAALIYLELQWEDDSRDKGLTKVCFDALVRTVLRETDSENRLGRFEILSGVRNLLPTHPVDIVDKYTNSTLSRFSKKLVRHWPNVDEFCLSYEERQRTNVRLLKLEYEDNNLLKKLNEILLIRSMIRRLSQIKQQKSYHSLFERWWRDSYLLEVKFSHDLCNVDNSNTCHPMIFVTSR